MPAAVPVRLRERVAALTGVLVVQLGLGAALLFGLRVDVLRRGELVSPVIDVSLRRPPAPPRRVRAQRAAAKRPSSAAPRAMPTPIGGSPGPVLSHAMPTPTPLIALRPTAPVSGGGSGSGPALGAGSGGGSGGQGYGTDDGGTDLVQIAGEIRPSDYPRDLRNRGIGGRVEMLFTVGANGRVTACTVTRSSGVPELDDLTCRLIRKRFRYRPSTDRYGRPVPDDVEGEHDWIAGAS